MTDDSPDPAFRQAAAAYQSAGKLRRPPVAPQIVRTVDLPASPASDPAVQSAPTPDMAALPPPQPSGAAAPMSESPSGGVSLMITNAQKEDLRRLGISEADIRNMTPADAHRRLGLSGR